MVYDYASLAAYLGRKESRPYASGHHTRLVRIDPDRIALRLHRTDVLTWYHDGRITYDSGGWRTATTKARMAEYGPVRIWSERGDWYVSDPRDPEHPRAYADGMTYHPGRGKTLPRLTGTGAPKQTRARAQECKRITLYVRAYIAALLARKIGLPGASDCGDCAILDANTGRPMGETQDRAHAAKDRENHLRHHIRERYFVPSLLFRALELHANAPFYRDLALGYMAPDDHAQADTAHSIRERNPAGSRGVKTLARALRRYLRSQLGHPA